MKLVFALVLSLKFLFSSTSVCGQNFKVPTNINYKNEDEYKTYQPQVIAAVDWLENTPFNVKHSKREKAIIFLKKWVEGSPSVSVLIRPYVQDLGKDNPQLLVLFLGGWARYAIQHPIEKSEHILNMAAIQTVLKAYQRGGLKNLKLDNLLRLQRKGELETWLSAQLKG